jgi:hypothetical protein
VPSYRELRPCCGGVDGGSAQDNPGARAERLGIQCKVRIGVGADANLAVSDAVGSTNRAAFEARDERDATGGKAAAD